jgi:hypothetical protein
VGVQRGWGYFHFVSPDALHREKGPSTITAVLGLGCRGGGGSYENEDVNGLGLGYPANFLETFPPTRIRSPRSTRHNYPEPPSQDIRRRDIRTRQSLREENLLNSKVRSRGIHAADPNNLAWKEGRRGDGREVEGDACPATETAGRFEDKTR